MSNQNPYEASSAIQPTPPPVDTGELTTIDWLLCILCSGIGCIVGIVRLVQGKKSGPKMIGFSILFAVLWNIVSFAIQAMVNQAP